jgi:hypothetical protein
MKNRKDNKLPVWIVSLEKVLLVKTSDFFYRPIMRVSLLGGDTMRKCNGNNTHEWGFDAIFDVKCQECGNTVDRFVGRPAS